MNKQQRDNFLARLREIPTLEPFGVHIPLDIQHKSQDRIWLLSGHILGDCCVIAGPPLLAEEEQEIYDILVNRMKARAPSITKEDFAGLKLDDACFEQHRAKVNIIDKKTWDLGPGKVTFQRLDTDDTSELSHLEGHCSNLTLTTIEEE